MEVSVVYPVRTDEGKYILNLDGWQIEVLRQALSHSNKQRESSRKYAAKKRTGKDCIPETKPLKPIFEIGY